MLVASISILPFKIKRDNGKDNFISKESNSRADSLWCLLRPLSKLNQRGRLETKIPFLFLYCSVSVFSAYLLSYIQHATTPTIYRPFYVTTFCLHSQQYFSLTQLGKFILGPVSCLRLSAVFVLLMLHCILGFLRKMYKKYSHSSFSFFEITRHYTKLISVLNNGLQIPPGYYRSIWKECGIIWVWRNLISDIDRCMG